MFLTEKIYIESSKVISKAKRIFRSNNFNKGKTCVLQSWSFKTEAWWMKGTGQTEPDPGGPIRLEESQRRPKY